MLTAEFKRRLIRLESSIHSALQNDSDEGGLLPSLIHVFSYLWFNSKCVKTK